MKYRSGDVVFVTNKKSWLSAIFRWFMMSRWSHTFVIAEQTASSAYIIETTSFESTFGTMAHYEDGSSAYEVWRPTRMTSQQLADVVAGSASQVGTLYGWLQFISLAVRCLGKRVGINVPNFIRQGLICDQLVLAGYTLSDIPGLKGIDPKSIETQELYEIVLAAKYADGVPAFARVYDQP